MTISFAAARSFLSIRVGRFELFAQREIVPVARLRRLHPWTTDAGSRTGRLRFFYCWLPASQMTE